MKKALQKIISAVLSTCRDFGDANQKGLKNVRWQKNMRPYLILFFWKDSLTTLCYVSLNYGGNPIEYIF